MSGTTWDIDIDAGIRSLLVYYLAIQLCNPFSLVSLRLSKCRCLSKRADSGDTCDGGCGLISPPIRTPPPQLFPRGIVFGRTGLGWRKFSNVHHEEGVRHSIVHADVAGSSRPTICSCRKQAPLRLMRYEKQCCLRVSNSCMSIYSVS